MALPSFFPYANSFKASRHLHDQLPGGWRKQTSTPAVVLHGTDQRPWAEILAVEVAEGTIATTYYSTCFRYEMHTPQNMGIARYLY